jgi:hypothetical protein
VNDIDKIENLVNEINSKDQELKDYQSMKIEELSDEIRRIISTQYETIQRIEELELKGIQSDLIKYAKIICRNSTERRIAQIQKIYFDKIDIKYRNHK